VSLDKLRSKIERLAREWQERVGLGWWIIEFQFNEETQDDYANTTALWQYSHALITWNLRNMSTLSDELLEDTIVHELAHCLLDPITADADPNTPQEKFAQKAMEYATERVARALILTWRAHG
jgi:Zn-dependent peptidase ImmA (M78 family)